MRSRLATLLLALAASLTQGQTADQTLSFEAASLKPADKNVVPGVTGRMTGGPGSTDPGRVTYTQFRLFQLLLQAWNVESYRLAVPQWVKAGPRDADWFNLTATMPPGTTKEQFQAMLRNLLTERFGIQLHHESRTYPGYELVVAPGGPKLKPPADPDLPEPEHVPSGTDADGFPLLPKGHSRGELMRSNGGIYMKFQDCPLAEMITPYLRGAIDQATGTTNHIVDKTGLDGKYDFSLKFDTRGAPAAIIIGGRMAPTGDSADTPSGLPDLFTAVEKQLGLKLVKSKFSLDTIVIDRIERKPTGN